jgi:hypothetical protein
MVSEPIDEAQLTRDVVTAQKAVDGALDDMRDLETDADGWPGADEIRDLAGEAAHALDQLSERLSHYLRGSDD